MRRRPLGRTGRTVSELAFGTAALGDVYGKTDPSAGERAVHAAIDAGIDWFDTAPLYGFGLAEERLGRALQGRRDRVTVATKCCRDTFERFDFSAARVTASLHESLRRLQTDHVDVYQIHDVEFGERRQVLEEAIPAALKLKEQGLVRHVGITGLPVRYLRSLLVASEVDLVMSWAHYNLLEDELATELAPLCAARGIGLLSASPLLQGLLTENPPPAWHRSPPEVLAVAPRLAALCRAEGLDLAQVAIRFAIGHPTIASTVVSIADEAQLQSNLAALRLELPPGLLGRLAAITAPVKNRMWFEGRPENNLPSTRSRS